MTPEQWGLLHGSQSGMYGTAMDMGQLSDKLLDFNSPYYQQYASYLRKATPGIGANTLLSPLMASGTGYGGGMSIANAKMKEFNVQRNDSINKGVQQFAFGNLDIGANLLGKKGDLLGNLGTMLQNQNQFEDKQDAEASKGMWSGIMKTLGTAAGILLAPATGGASLIPAAMATSGGGGGDTSSVYGYGRF